ncbi:MAG: methylenetetrahydrofolate reductase [Planctomycetota bacterium]|nr:methylenetetrahydrofolate reductase [Planctomycetota bacterium]
MSQLQQRLAAGEFVVTGEIGPPKGTNVGPVLHEAEQYLKGRVVAVNVTDIQTAVMRTGSMAMCKLLLDRGIEPIFQMVCRDRNRLALQSDLLSAAVLGIENVLSLTGDHVVMGDHRDAKPVYDLDSVGLLQAMSRLQAGSDLGLDMKGQPNKLDGVPKFFKGCCTTPCSPDPEAQIIKLEKKAAAGAQFVQTLAVYDPATFEKFMKRIGHIKIPVLVGIVVLKSAGMAKYMNRAVPGVQVPDALIKELAAAPKENLKKVSAEIAGRLVREMKGMCQGAHLMTLGWDDVVPDILQSAGLAS